MFFSCFSWLLIINYLLFGYITIFDRTIFFKKNEIFKSIYVLSFVAGIFSFLLSFLWH